MALHRKQRGIVDAAPQYVRIPASRASSQAASYSLHETHPHAQRVYAKRYAAGDRSRKISSLQLRACFLLCVLLYFGAIYFADDIASIGRVVGSEQNSQSFFVHSLRPRGRGSVRVGRAVDAKKVEATGAPDDAEEQQQHLDQDDLPTKLPKVETHSPEAEVATAESENAQATEPLEQPETETEVVHLDEKNAHDNVPGDAVHPDDQGEDIPADRIEDTNPTSPGEDTPVVEKVDTISMIPVKPNTRYDDAQKGEQEGSNATSAPKKHAARDQPHPSPALRHPEKVGELVAVPAASPARIEKQHIRGNVEDKSAHPNQQANRNQNPSEELRPDHEQQQEQQPAETAEPAVIPTQAKESMTEHISDI